MTLAAADASLLHRAQEAEGDPPAHGPLGHAHEPEPRFVCMYLDTHVRITLYVYIYIYIYIISPLTNKTHLIKKKNLGEQHICYYQFRRRHDYPPHKRRCLVRSTPLIITPPP